MLIPDWDGQEETQWLIMNKLFFCFFGGLKFTAPNYLALTWNRHRCLLPAPFLNDRQVRCAWSTFVKFLSCPSLPTQPVTTGHVHLGTMGDTHWWCYTPEHLLGPAAFARPVQYTCFGGHQVNVPFTSTQHLCGKHLCRRSCSLGPQNAWRGRSPARCWRRPRRNL